MYKMLHILRGISEITVTHGISPLRRTMCYCYYERLASVVIRAATLEQEGSDAETLCILSNSFLKRDRDM